VISLETKTDFENITDDIIKNEEFLKLKEEVHHGLSRFSHSEVIAKKVYKIAKAKKLDVVSATRGALLHDFFFRSEFSSTVELFITHPNSSLRNAKKHFKLNKKEQNIISSHMFPLSLEMPRSKEAWLVTYIDTIIATKDFFYKYKVDIKKYAYLLSFFFIKVF